MVLGWNGDHLSHHLHVVLRRSRCAVLGGSFQSRARNIFGSGESICISGGGTCLSVSIFWSILYLRRTGILTA